MKGSLYRERDYAFGQLILTVRTKLKLTQTELAEKLGVRRRAVIDWEGGLTYPTADHLKHFVTLTLEHQVFSTGREAEELRALWHAAHQKVLLDEVWLAGLLSDAQSSLASQSGEKSSVTVPPPDAPIPPSRSERRVDWGDAPDVASFYGREWELDLLAEWLVEERCRVVSVLGQGGIGKSALATKVMHHVAKSFEVVIWRSLRDVPSCEALLDSCLQVLAPQGLSDASSSIVKRQDLLLECLRNRRVLLVYDNVESFLEGGEESGRIRADYESFARVLRRVAETEHQSCWLLTSREKSSELVPLEGSRAPVRALRLARLDAEACQQLLAEKGVAGSTPEHLQLVETYAGNPLALKIVAQTIVDLFDGQIMPFLEQGGVVFGGVRALLDEQYTRLSATEQSVLVWLAILREPVTLQELLARLSAPLQRAHVLEAVESLRRRSLIEPVPRQGSFTLHAVVMEYVSARLITEIISEIQQQGRFSHLIDHGLTLAGSREDIRQTQVRLLVAPILAGLRSTYPRRSALEERLLALLIEQREREDSAQGYGPANLLALLRELRGHLRGLDLSQLSLRDAYLQGVEMQDTTLAKATLQKTVFTESFDPPWSVATSSRGSYWAMGSRRGGVRVWREDGQMLEMAWQAHTAAVQALAFSPNEHMLATGSWDGTLKLWNLENRTLFGGQVSLLWVGQHTGSIHRLAFTADGHMLAGGGDDAAIRLWDVSTGKHLQTLNCQSSAVYALAWSPDGSWLSSGTFDGSIHLWQTQGVEAVPLGTATHILTGHGGPVWSVAFAPDGRTLASGSFDRTVKLWDVEGFEECQTLAGHTAPVNAVAWSPDGRMLASGGRDQMIWIWDSERGSYHTALHGHTAVVHDLAFLPDSRSLLSGSEDGSLRVWDVERGQCTRVIQGFAVTLYDVAWNADGTKLASAGSDSLVTIWERDGRTPPRLLRGHSWIAYGVAWSPDGRWLASSGLDNAIQLWDVTTEASIQILRDPNHLDTSFFGIEWSPDGKFLAAGTYQQEVQVWEVPTGTCLWVGHGQSTTIRRVAWSPDGSRLASCGYDGIVVLWQADTGMQLARLQGHHGMVMCVVWSHDGTRLASGGGGQGGGELFVWDAGSGEPLYSLSELNEVVYALAWSPTGRMLISGDSDGMLRWWDVEHRKCVQTRQAHQGTIQSLKVSPDGQWLSSCGDDGTINIWELEGGELRRTLRRDRPYERLDISEVQGLTQAQKASLRALGAIERAPVPDNWNALRESSHQRTFDA
jgi:WD40 repeat protein/transcriptional regulator with XRE-family HTH domain